VNPKPVDSLLEAPSFSASVGRRCGCVLGHSCFIFKYPKIFPRLSFIGLWEKQAQALVAGELDFMANAANLCSLLWHCLPDINGWAFTGLSPKD
jgi:hypothetical protein